MGQDTEPEAVLLRPQQVARLLGVGRTTVHEYEKDGRLEATKTLGGHRRYRADQPALQGRAVR